MRNDTASDWLRNEGLSDIAIDFVEMILTFTSAAKKLNNKLDEINESFQTSFPDKKVEINPNLTFSQFDKILRDNGITIDLIEMLTRYKEQSICVNLCNQLLES